MSINDGFAFDDGSSNSGYLVSYNADEALRMLNDTMAGDIVEIKQRMAELTDTLVKLQESCHDVQGTSIHEDYKDIEALLGHYYEKDGLCKFMINANAVCAAMYANVLKNKAAVAVANGAYAAVDTAGSAVIGAGRAVGGAVDAASDAVVGAGKAVSSAATTAAGAVGSAAVSAGKAVGSAATTAAGAVGEAATTVGHVAVTSAGIVNNVATGIAGGVVHGVAGVAGVAGDVATAAVNAGKDVVGTVAINAGNGLADAGSVMVDIGNSIK